MKKFKVVGLGGTFDHFHAGHESFIRFAWELGEKLLIGVTDGELALQRDYPDQVQNYEVRSTEVKNFCKKNGIKAEVFKISDIYGPTINSGTSVEALVVTIATEKGAIKINQVRVEAGLNELPVFVHQLLLDKTGKIINSTRIRGGEINRAGEYWLDTIRGGLEITEAQKKLLSLPQGDVFTSIFHQDRVINNQSKTSSARIVVGDFSLNIFTENNWRFDLAFFDRKIERQRVEDQNYLDYLSSQSVIASVRNNPGEISQEVYDLLSNWDELLNSDQKLIEVLGEEDLIAAAIVLRAPLGTEVFYGQPGEGMVRMKVSEQLKNQVKKILEHI